MSEADRDNGRKLWAAAENARYSQTAEGKAEAASVARKDDSGKLRFDLVPPEFDEALAEVLTFGAKKYGDRNWEQGAGIDGERLFAACMRHLTRVRRGELLDQESGLPHLAHAATNLLMWHYHVQRAQLK